jgi:hypothetical protein
MNAQVRVECNIATDRYECLFCRVLLLVTIHFMAQSDSESEVSVRFDANDIHDSTWLHASMELFSIVSLIVYFVYR